MSQPTSEVFGRELIDVMNEGVDTGGCMVASGLHARHCSACTLIEVRACATEKKTSIVHGMQKVHALSGWVKRGGASLVRGAHSELDGHTHLIHLLKQLG
jgi:hypothetical protein